MESTSRADRLRRQGNEHYTAACGAISHGPAGGGAARAQLGLALGFYQSALQASRTAAERAPAAKNAGVCASKLLSLVHNVPSTGDAAADPAQAWRLAQDAKAACAYLQTAREAGVAAGKDVAWLRSVEEMTEEVVTSTLALTSHWLSENSGSLRTVVDALSHGAHASLPAVAAALAHANTRLAEKLLQASVLLVSAFRGDKPAGDAATATAAAEAEATALRAGRPLLADASACLCRARQLASVGQVEDVALQASMHALAETLELHAAILDCAVLRLVGEVQLKRAVCGDERICYDGVWAALDTFREAVRVAHEKDLEGEAAALSFMGTIWGDVLLKPERARIAFAQSVRLALAASPRCFTGVPWFTTAQAAVQAQQERTARVDEAEKSRREEELLESKAAECDAITRAAGKGAVTLLQHIYVHHPPARAGDSLGSVAADDLKKTLQMAIVHYHPDKQPKDDPVAVAVAGFICKRLTAAYQIFK